MIKQYAYKYQLRPRQKKEALMSKMAGCCRFVWNKALALQKEKLDSKERIMSYVQLASLLLVWKQKYPFLVEAPSQSLQQTLKNLDRTLRDAFKKKKQFPRFKKKNICDSFLYPQGHKLDQNNSRIFLPKLGWMRYRNSRFLHGIPKNVTVSRYSGKWFAAIQVKQEVPEPQHPQGPVIGIDMGVAKFAVCSDGIEILPLSSFKSHEHRLTFLQRQLSRKQKFSQNWYKQKDKISKYHAKIANCRKDFLHKITTAISKNHAIVVVEDLKVSNMSKSAKGIPQNPGRNVKAKAGLNKSILDQGWFEFRRQLEYKLRWQGGRLIAVRPQYTSQQCSACGYLDADNRKTQAHFSCVACGHTENADYNAAKNIKAAGLAVLASGGNDTSRPVKEEPTVLSSISLGSIQSESSCFS